MVRNLPWAIHRQPPLIIETSPPTDTTLQTADQSKKTKKLRKKLACPMRHTTPPTLSVHPLLWGLGHLDLFHISVELMPVIYQRPEETKKCPPAGYIASSWFDDVPYGVDTEGFWLADTIVEAVDAFQESLEPKPFVFVSAKRGSKKVTPMVHLGNKSFLIFPDLIVRTKTGFPFLLHNPLAATKELRLKFPHTRAGRHAGGSRWSFAAHNFDPRYIDPYDVAGLLALAQEQLEILRYHHQPLPHTLKVYYMLEDTSSQLASIWLYTAEFPVSYLYALEEGSLGITEKATIRREFVYLPTRPVDGKNVEGGRFLGMFADIFEEAQAFEKSLSEAAQFTQVTEEVKIKVVDMNGNEVVCQNSKRRGSLKKRREKRAKLKAQRID